MSSDHPLPKGAIELDLGELLLALARDKLIFTHKGAREHYTLHLKKAYTDFFGKRRRWQSRTDNANIAAIVFATRTLFSLLGSLHLIAPSRHRHLPRGTELAHRHMGFTPEFRCE